MVYLPFEIKEKGPKLGLPISKLMIVEGGEEE